MFVVCSQQLRKNALFAKKLRRKQANVRKPLSPRKGNCQVCGGKPPSPQEGELTRLWVSIVEVNCGSGLREILTGWQDCEGPLAPKGGIDKIGGKPPSPQRGNWQDCGKVWWKWIVEVNCGSELRKWFVWDPYRMTNCVGKSPLAPEGGTDKIVFSKQWNQQTTNNQQTINKQSTTNN